MRFKKATNKELKSGLNIFLSVMDIFKTNFLSLSTANLVLSITWLPIQKKNFFVNLKNHFKVLLKYN